MAKRPVDVIVVGFRNRRALGRKLTERQSVKITIAGVASIKGVRCEGVGEIALPNPVLDIDVSRHARKRSPFLIDGIKCMIDLLSAVANITKIRVYNPHRKRFTAMGALPDGDATFIARREDETHGKFEFLCRSFTKLECGAAFGALSPVNLDAILVDEKDLFKAQLLYGVNDLPILDVHDVPR
jgi:hypothetical protein